MSTVIIRNGEKLCAKCKAKGCNSFWGDAESEKRNVETEYVSDEPCQCCEQDFTTNDGFGI